MLKLIPIILISFFLSSCSTNKHYSGSSIYSEPDHLNTHRKYQKSPQKRYNYNYQNKSDSNSNKPRIKTKTIHPKYKPRTKNTYHMKKTVHPKYPGYKTYEEDKRHRGHNEDEMCRHGKCDHHNKWQDGQIKFKYKD